MGLVDAFAPRVMFISLDSHYSLARPVEWALFAAVFCGMLRDCHPVIL
jgi:hypothetical protein